MSVTAFINARLIDPATGLDETGRLITEGGRIAAVEPGQGKEGLAEFANIVDCGGHVLAPGLIDMRVFIGEPGAEHKETIGSASEAAAAGGVTTIIVMPDTNPIIDDVALVDFLNRRARDTALVNIRPMAAITKGFDGQHMTEIGLLSEAGAAGFTDGDRPISDSLVMRRVLAYASEFDTVIVQHAEDLALTANGVMNEGEYALRLGLPGIPEEAESIIVERDMQILGLTGGRYHLGQISAKKSLDAIHRAKAAGLAVTCAASVYHLTLNEMDVADYRTFAKVNPPLRHEETRLALVDALAKGLIDVIVSSHRPEAPEDKRLPFAEAKDGTVGLETLLPAALQLVHEDQIALHKVLAALTANPAKILGLDAGRLAVGAPADLALIDLGFPFKVDPATLRSRSRNTVFEGRTLQGRVLRTVVAGQTVFEAESD
jgi:dihydroorotase